MTSSGHAPPIPAPAAPRLRRPSWRDPRLLIGLLLILTSVAVGSRVVALADHTRPVYAARTTLPSGTPLTSGVLEVVRLRITGTSAGYLDARVSVPAGRVLLRAVGAGELIPLSALGSADLLDARPVSIPIDGSPPAGLSVGGLVDLWASAKRGDAAGGGYGEPDRIAHEVEVYHVDRPGTGLSATGETSVEVLLPAQALPDVLDALANDARVVVLPLPGSRQS